MKYELAEYDVFVSVPAKVFSGERITPQMMKKSIRERYLLSIVGNNG